MKFKRMIGEMLYSYKKLDFSFIYSGGVTLIISKNLDQNTNNGGGKTSIAKILYFGLYGSDLNKAVKSEIPNRNGNGSYYFSLDLEDNGHELRIERFAKRKDLHPLKTDKECLNLYIDGKLLMGAATGHDIDVVQETIINRIKISPRLFLSSVLTKQNVFKGNTIDFLRANDTQKKEILAEILDLMSYVKAHDVTKKEISLIEDRKKEKQTRIDSLKDQILLLEEQNKDQNNLFQTFDTTKNSEIKKLEDQLVIERNKLKNLKAKLIKLDDLEIIKENIKKLEESISPLQSLISEEVNLNKEYSSLTSKYDQNLKEIKTEYEKQEKINIFLNKKFELDFKLKNNELIAFEDISDINENNILDKLLSFESKRDKNIEFLKKEDYVKKTFLEQSELLLQLEKDIDKLSYDINACLKNINDLENAQSCPTCDRDFDEKHKENHIKPKIEKYNLELNSLKNIFSLKQIEKNKLNEETINQLKNELISIDENKKQYNKNNQIINVLKNILDELNNFQKQKEENKNDLNNVIVKIKSLNEDNNLLSDKISNLKIKIDSLNPTKVEFENFNNLLKLEKEKQTNFDKNLIFNQQINNQVLLVTENGKKLAENLKKTKEASNPHLEIIDKNNLKIKAIQENISKYESSISKDDTELKYLKFWLLGFSPTGIRSFISDDLIEILNQKVASHLEDLFDGALNVLFVPESENNKGVSVNKIETKYFLNGKEVSEESLSGGQIQRCILATDLALTEVAESRSGTRLNIKFLDEPFTGMDSAGQQQAFRLFNKLAKEKDGFFVISHDENFQSLCANTIHILYKNETSEIVSKDEFNQYTVGEEQSLTENVFDDKKENFSNYLKRIASKNK